MARPVKKGLDFHYTDNYIFSDRKIKIIMSEYGSDGYTLYSYLKCEIFKEGYYLRVDEDLKNIAASDLNMSPNKIGQMIGFFCKRSLFDDKLFTTDKALTSADIQRTYQRAIKARAAKRTVCVDSRLWLLKNDETEAFIEVRPNENKSEKNRSKSENNPNKSEINPQSKVNKSKVNKSKVKCVSGACAPDTSTHTDGTNHEIIDCLYEIPTQNGVYRLTSEYFKELEGKYPSISVSRSLEKLIDYLNANPDKCRYNRKQTEGYISMWLSNDESRAKAKSAQGASSFPAAYDIDFEEDYEQLLKDL